MSEAAVTLLEKIGVPAALLLIGAGITFITSWYWRRKADSDRAVEKARDAAIAAAASLQARLGEVESQLALVRQAVVPISAAFQAMLVKQLTHYHTPVMDALLVKLGPPYMLTEDEERALIIELEKRTQEAGSLLTESERDAAAMLPMVIKRVKAEAALGLTDFD